MLQMPVATLSVSDIIMAASRSGMRCPERLLLLLPPPAAGGGKGTPLSTMGSVAAAAATRDEGTPPFSGVPKED